MSLMAGVAKHVITPYVGIGMEGNAREEGSIGIHDDLTARALILSDGAQTCALVALDVCMLPKDVVARARELIVQRLNLPPQNILIAATHTHAGPVTVGLFGEKPDEAYLHQLAAYAFGVVREAYDKQQPVCIGFGYAYAQAPVHNRRLQTKDGAVHMNWEKLDPSFVVRALGPTDPEIALMRVDTLAETPLAVLFNYALHPAILAGDNWLLSADWPGYARQAIEQLYGGTAIFFNGATGNVNHINYRRPEQKRGFYEAQRLGTMIGAAAVQGLLQIEKLESEICLQAQSRVISLPGRRVTAEQIHAAEAILAQHQGPLVQAATDGASEALFAAEALKLAARGAFTENVEVQAMRLGPAALLAFPAEMFVEYQLQFKRLSPCPYNFLIGYANDYVGYVPTPVALTQGGYEAQPMSWSKLAPEAGERLLNTGLTLLQEMK